jgi:hypothetical protein
LRQQAPIDGVILEHPLDVIARLGKGDQLQPVDQRVELLPARVAMQADPLVDPRRPGVVRHDREREVVVTVDHLLQIMAAEADVVVGIAGQQPEVVGQPELAGHQRGRARHELEEAPRPGRAHHSRIEHALLAG